METFGIDAISVAHDDNVTLRRLNDDNNHIQCTNRTVGSKVMKISVIYSENIPAPASAIDAATSDCKPAECYPDRPSVYSTSDSQDMGSKNWNTKNMFRFQQIRSVVFVAIWIAKVPIIVF